MDERINALTLQMLKTALAQPLPGSHAQARMWITAAPGPSAIPAGLKLRLSAVLILIYQRSGALTIPLLLRTDRVADHKGQISLPGGQQDPTDASFLDTATREAHEELGVDRTSVQYAGALTPHYIASSHFRVFPFVGWLNSCPQFQLNEESAALIELPLERLLNPATKARVKRELHGVTIDVPCYRFGEHIIWGATAMILSEFEAVLANIESH